MRFSIRDEDFGKTVNILLTEVEKNDREAFVKLMDMAISFHKQNVHLEVVRRIVGEVRKGSSDAWAKFADLEPSLVEEGISLNLLEKLRDDPTVFNNYVKNAMDRKLLNESADPKLQTG